MKHLLSLLFLLCLSTSVYSAPNYDPNYKTVTYDKEMYNIKLRNKLEAEYDKKCIVADSPNSHKNICGVNSYDEYVEIPYLLQKRNFNYD